MEEILGSLLVPDNDTITQATDALRDALKSPDAVPSLCNVLSSSKSSQIRQYAAVVLRKRLTKQKHWNKLPDPIKAGVKMGILPQLVNEKEKSVKMAVVQLIAAIAKHELTKGMWPELQKFLRDLVTSSSPSDVELGMFIMSVLTDVALDVLSGHSDWFVFLFNQTHNALDDLTSVLGYYTVTTMTHTVPVCEKSPDLQAVYGKSIQKILKGLPALVDTDEERACEVFEFFSEVISSEIPMAAQELAHFVDIFLEIGVNKKLGPVIRNKAMTLIGIACHVKKKLILKVKYVKRIVQNLFLVMCEPPEGGEEEEEQEWYVSDDDSESTFQNATSVLGEISLYLPPEVVVENVVEIVAQGLQDQSPYVKKACFLALAIVTDGASECIRNKYLSIFLQHVRSGITFDTSVVRNAALFALGKLAEQIQPEISEYAEELMPILFEYLAHLCQRLEKGGSEPPGLFSMFYALEAFCENLEEKLVPYLPMLMERLFMILNPNHSVAVLEHALSTIGSVTSAVKTGILPYFSDIIEKIKTYLLQKHTEETACLQVQALETLGVLARTLGEEHFGALANETAMLGLTLLENNGDPDLKRGVYCLFGALSGVMKDSSATFFPKLIESCILSLKSTEGVVPHFKEDDGPFPLFEDLSDIHEEEDIGSTSDVSSDEDEVGFSVENPYMEEKEEACSALKDFAANAGAPFLPYLQTSYQVVIELTTYPYDDVRKCSFETLAQFCVNFSKIESTEGKEALQAVLLEVVPKCIEVIKKDDEVTVVNAALEALSTMLSDIGSPVLAGQGHLDEIISSIVCVLKSETECQGNCGDVEDDDEEEAELYEMLMETAGEIIPNLGKAMPAANFVICLQNLLKLILPKLNHKSSTSQRSFFTGTLAECMAPAGPELEKQQNFALQLLNLYLQLAQDPSYEVRNNAIFGLGELVLHSKESLYPKYMDILCFLSNATSKETNAGVIDNIVGALARLILVNHELIPMENVFPGFLEKLPLRKDFDEYSPVLRCFGRLYQLGHPLLQSNISNVIRICCLIIHEKQGKDEAIHMASELLKTCRKDFLQELTAVVQSLPPEAATNISNLLSS